MGPRMREDTGGWTVNLPRLHGGRLFAGKTGVGVRGTGDHEGRPYGVRRRGWVSAFAGTAGGGGLGVGPAAGEDFGGGAFEEDLAVTVPVDG